MWLLNLFFEYGWIFGILGWVFVFGGAMVVG